MQGGGIAVVVEDFEAAFVFGIEAPVFGLAVVEEVEDAAGRQAVVMVMGFAVGKVDLRDETERGLAVVGPVDVRRQVWVAAEAGGAKRDVFGLVGGEGDGVAHQRFDGLPVVVQAVGAEGLFEGCGHGGSSFWVRFA